MTNKFEHDTHLKDILLIESVLNCGVGEDFESPLECKIKPVNPTRNQSWIFIGRTDAESEVPTLWPPDSKKWLTGKDLDAGKDWRQEEKGATENKMVGWHYQLNGHEFKQAPGDGEGQGGLTCCSPWSCRVGHDWATKQLFNYSTTFSYMWNYPMSKSLKSIFIFNAFPSYQHTEHQAKILSLNFLISSGKRKNT